METTSASTYTILGGDGQHYGPVTAEQFREWARDGRVNAQTQVMPAGSTAWCAAASLPELGMPIATPTPVSVSPLPTQSVPIAIDPELDHRIRSGASWFYWISALTLITSVCWFAKVNFSFALGMGVTRHIDYRMDFSPAMTLVLDVLICGLVAVLGFFAIKRQSWAFIAGLIILVLDTLLCVQQEAWFSVAFHVWAIASIFMAFRASRAARG